MRTSVTKESVVELKRSFPKMTIDIDEQPIVTCAPVLQFGFTYHPSVDRLPAMGSIAILAEIADKMPTLTETVAVSTVVACLASGAARIRWWAFAVVTFPILAIYDLGLVSDLCDPTFAPALWREMGAEYVYGQFLAVNGPIVLAAAALVARHFLKRSRAAAC
jgi:hypothetical protein